MQNDVTNNYGFALPHPTNLLSEDVGRIRQSFEAIDAEFSNHTNAVTELVNDMADLTNTINQETQNRQTADTNLSTELQKIRILALAGL